MKSPFFSIVIPTLNEEKCLPRLLACIERQTEKSLEVIVVDGNSEDRTKEYANKFKDKLSLQFHINKKKNVSYQRNFGSRKASGKYLVFLDADIYINPSFLKKLKKVIKKNKHLLLMPGIFTHDPSFKGAFKIVNQLVKFSHMTGKPYSLGGSMVFEKNYFAFLGGFDEKLYLAEDHEIVQRAKNSGVTACFLDSIKLSPSLRRFKKEGRLALLKKYLVSTVHTIKSGRIEKKIYEYEMGGGAYKVDEKQSEHIESSIFQFTGYITDKLKKLI